MILKEASVHYMHHEERHVGLFSNLNNGTTDLYWKVMETGLVRKTHPARIEEMKPE
jgi:hypothetical protein